MVETLIKFTGRTIGV